MIHGKSGRRNDRAAAFCLSLLCLALFLPAKLTAQTPPSTAVIMVQIHCNPGTSNQWREAFEKEEVPVIREIVKRGDTFTSFTYFEAPLPAQDVDFILIFELKSFAALDVRQIPPHWEGLLRRLGPERFAAYEKQMGTYEKTVRVSILRSYKVQ
jgi:hypothetical protein